MTANDIANALSVSMTSRTRISATPRSLMFQVPGAGCQVQIARRDIELDLEVRHLTTRGPGETPLCEQQPGWTAQRRHRALDAERDAHAADAQQVGIESIACGRIGTPWTIGEERWRDLDAPRGWTECSQSSLVMAVDDSECAVLSRWPPVERLVEWRRLGTVGSAQRRLSFVDDSRRLWIAKVSEHQLHDVIEERLRRIESFGTNQLKRA